MSQQFWDNLAKTEKPKFRCPGQNGQKSHVPNFYQYAPHNRHAVFQKLWDSTHSLKQTVNFEIEFLHHNDSKIHVDLSVRN